MLYPLIILLSISKFLWPTVDCIIPPMNIDCLAAHDIILTKISCPSQETQLLSLTILEEGIYKLFLLMKEVLN